MGFVLQTGCYGSLAVSFSRALPTETVGLCADMLFFGCLWTPLLVFGLRA